MKHSLSVIIPVFNYLQNGKYLTELLYRIQNQSESKFKIIEVILINDSPEYDLKSLLNYDEVELNLIFINNIKNYGQAFSRNVGIDISKGDFLHIIDQDDLIDFSFYANISNVEYLNITNCFLFNENHMIQHMKKTKLWILNFFKEIASLKPFLIFDNIVLSPGQLVINRIIFDKVGNFPILEKYGSDDYGFMFNLTYFSINYTFSKNSNFYHRLHENQGKNILNMTESKKEFLNNYIVKNSLFKKLCLINIFPFNIIKKISYLFFYNRLV